VTRAAIPRLDLDAVDDFLRRSAAVLAAWETTKTLVEQDPEDASCAG
jgi:hypothetical protein